MIMEQWNVLLVLVLESILSFMLLVRGEEYEKGANVTLTFNHQLQSSTTTYYCNIFVRGGSRPFVVNGRLEQDGLKTGQEGRFDFQLHETGKYLDIMLSISQIDTIDEGVYIVSIAEVYGGVTHPNTYEARVHVTYPPGRAECEFRTQPLPGSDWRTLLCTATTGNDGSGILTCVGNSKRLPYLQPVTINGSVISGEFWIDPSLEARCCSIDGVSVLIFDSKTCDHFVHSPQDQTSSASPYSHSAESTNTIPTTPQTASDDAVVLINVATVTAQTSQNTAYFNGSASVTTNTNFDPNGQLTFQFRTCAGGGFISQSYNGQSITVSVDESNGSLRVEWNDGTGLKQTNVGQDYNDNLWTLLDFSLIAGVFVISVQDEVTEVTSLINLQNLDLSGAAGFSVGDGYTGCLEEVAGLNLAGPVSWSNVAWGECPLEADIGCGPQDPCASQPCLNNGVCSSSGGGFQCSCTARYNGTTCDVDNGSLCSNQGYALQCGNGTCVEDGISNSTFCDCDPGFGGGLCDSPFTLCDNNPCANGGTCRSNAALDGTICFCIAGYFGDDCSMVIDNCMVNPCLNNGACVNSVNSYSCNCSQTGYTGQRCEIQRDDCAQNPCQNSGACTDTSGWYYCSCTVGNVGANCDQNLCSYLTPCENGGICNAAQGDFTCTCVAGFSGDLCEINIDECAPMPCQNGGFCVDAVNGFQCFCIQGFIGSVCSIELNECNQADLNMCENNSTCVDRAAGIECACVPGFIGVFCETNIDECESSPCTNNATCVDLVNEYRCLCSAGFTGQNCGVNIDECASEPCLNGGQCNDQISGYICVCLPGYESDNCDINIDECASSPCQNGATCMDLVNGYRCNCAGGYNGVQCGNEIDECASSPCLNGATCADLIDAFMCECAEGWGDTTCDVALIACDNNVDCQNGATCFSYYNVDRDTHEFDCLCAPGFTGDMCTEDTSISFVGMPGASGYVSYDFYLQNQPFHFTLTFATTIPEGYLLFAQAFGQSVTVDVQEGKLSFTFSNGQDVFNSIINMDVNNGEWYTLEISLSENDATSTVVNMTLTSNSCSSGMCHSGQDIFNFQLPSFSNVYFGGVFGTPALGTPINDPFTGCMRDVSQLADSPVMGGDSSREPMAGCSRTPQCGPDLCNGRETCTDLWWTFTCECQLGYTGPSCETTIPIQAFVTEPLTTQATTDKSVVLQCVVEYKEGTLQWSKDGLVISSDMSITNALLTRYNITGNESNGEFNLRIDTVSMEDAGTYGCRVTASGLSGEIVSRDAILTVYNTSQRIVTPPSDVTVTVGTSQSIVTPPSDVTVTVGTSQSIVTPLSDVTVTVGTSQSIVTPPSNVTATVGTSQSIVTPPSDGTVTVGTSQSIVIPPSDSTVTVGTLQSIVTPPSNVTVTVGTSATMVCNVTGLSGNVEWLKNGVKISRNREIIYGDMSGRVSITGSDATGEYHLSIAEVQLKDDALYFCTLSPGANGDPSVSSPHAKLTVEDTSSGGNTVVITLCICLTVAFVLITGLVYLLFKRGKLCKTSDSSIALYYASSAPAPPPRDNHAVGAISSDLAGNSPAYATTIDGQINNGYFVIGVNLDPDDKPPEYETIPAFENVQDSDNYMALQSPTDDHVYLALDPSRFSVASKTSEKQPDGNEVGLPPTEASPPNPAYQMHSFNNVSHV